MSSLIYNRSKGPDGSYDWDDGSQTFKVLLVTSSYTPDPDHDFISDVSADEVTDVSYARATLGGRTFTVDDTNDRVELAANNVTFSALSASFRYAIISRIVTDDAHSPLIACLDLSAQSVTGADFTIKWNGGSSSGDIIRIS